MNHHLPYYVFLLLIVPSVIVGIHDYKMTERSIEQDMQQALAQTLLEKRRDVITADTIRTFNSHLRWTELRGNATLSLSTSCPTSERDKNEEGELQLQAHCPTLTIWRLSDQRPSLALASMALLWAAGCGIRKRKETVTEKSLASKGASFDVKGTTIGGLTLADNRFLNSHYEMVRFTPMQQQLMEMFFLSATHSLSKAEICEALWPKKPDASETLYTLIRRLRPLLKQNSNLIIESDRNRGYFLKVEDTTKEKSDYPSA